MNVSETPLDTVVHHALEGISLNDRADRLERETQDAVWELRAKGRIHLVAAMRTLDPIAWQTRRSAGQKVTA